MVREKQPLRRGDGLLAVGDYVSGGVAEAGGDLGGVCADGLDDFASVGDVGVVGGGHAKSPPFFRKAREQKDGAPGGRPRTQAPLTSPTAAPPTTTSPSRGHRGLYGERGLASLEFCRREGAWENLESSSASHC